ncbi:MAG: HDOD domain-containing protein [Acidobacteria bacterium]|nr:HDOD domain-containing protein [Acidobacteriota bacterium]
MITEERLRQRARTLPSLPATVVALGEAVADERCTVDRILRILATDPPLSATMLRMANSVLYGGDQPVTELRPAVMRLGFETILNLGRTAGVIRSYREARHLDAVRLWQHSVAVGLVAKGTCRILRRPHQGEEAFMAGLLHDIGKIALDLCFPEEYGPVVEAIQAGQHTVDAEAALLGTTHAEVGHMLARQWELPEVLGEAILRHHAPGPGQFLNNLIHLCDLLVRTRIPGGPADERLVVVLEEMPAFREVFGSAEGPDLERLTFEIDDELDHAVAFVTLAYQG